MKRQKMKVAYLCAICMMLCASCNQEETVPIPEKLTEKSFDWGFFNGTIGEKNYSLENTKDVQFVKSTRKAITIDFHTQWFLNTIIEYTPNSSLVVELHQLEVGTYYITLGYPFDEHTSCLEVVNEINKCTYWPKPEKPIKVEITNLDWDGPDHPILKANIDGVVYNTKDSKDSITIRGSYGAR